MHLSYTTVRVRSLPSHTLLKTHVCNLQPLLRVVFACACNPSMLSQVMTQRLRCLSRIWPTSTIASSSNSPTAPCFLPLVSQQRHDGSDLPDSVGGNLT